VGRVKVVMVLPRKNPTTRFKMKYAKKTITRPTTAATIVFLAASTLVLSPPDRIHLIPPQIKNPNAIRTASMKRRVITFPTTFPKLLDVSLQRPAKSPVGQVSTVSAKAKAGERR